MLVGAFVAIWTFITKIMDVAHLEFAHAVDFGFCVCAEWVDALTLAITWNGSRNIRRRWAYF